MDYITKLSQESPASIRKYLLLGYINNWERKFLVNSLYRLYINRKRQKLFHNLSKKQLNKLKEIYYKINNHGFLFNDGEFLVNKYTDELVIVYSTSIMPDNKRLYKLKLCNTSDIIDLEKNEVEASYSLAEI
jgi:hypothetical protein